MDAENRSTCNEQGNRNFFLIGFMGSGKTHWGKKWAVANNFSFVDLDELIEIKEQRIIDRIFETDGEDYFRKLEAAVLRSCDSLHKTIIACGGGTPCFFKNMAWMHGHGTTIYLSSTPEEIIKRILPEKEKRPLIKKLREDELFFFITEKLQERAPFYIQAQFTLQSELLDEHTFAGIINNTITKPTHA